MNSSLSVALFSQDVHSELLVRVSESHRFLPGSPIGSVSGSRCCGGLEQDGYFRAPDV